MKTSALLVAAVLAGCSSDPSMGTGSQTGNSIVAGRVMGDNGLPAASVPVALRPADWTPSQVAAANRIQYDTTDLDGSFRFQDVPADTYFVEARWKGKAWCQSIGVAGRPVEGMTANLRTQGRLECHVRYGEAVAGGRIELAGLDRSIQLPTTVFTEMRYTIDSLPPCLLTLRIRSNKTNSVIWETPVRIGSDSTTKVEYAPSADANGSSGKDAE